MEFAWEKISAKPREELHNGKRCAIAEEAASGSVGLRFRWRKSLEWPFAKDALGAGFLCLVGSQTRFQLFKTNKQNVLFS